MNWVDALIVIVLILYLFDGVRRGFLQQAMELIGFVITVVLSVLFYKLVGRLITDFTDIKSQIADPIGFFVLWFVLQFLYSLLLRYAYHLIPEIIRKSLPNRVAGVVPAILKAIVVIAVITTIIVALPVPAKLKNSVDTSAIGNVFVKNSSVVENFLKSVFHLDLNDGLTFTTIPAQTEQIIKPDEVIQLGYTTDKVTYDLEAGKRMLVMVNEERKKVGVKELVWDEKLLGVANAHSADMFKRGYFSHVDPDGLSPFDRLEKAGITFKYAGENLALAPTVDAAHGGLMRSEGHRENILKPEFGRIGIGVVDGGIYGKMFTQMFMN